MVENSRSLADADRFGYCSSNAGASSRGVAHEARVPNNFANADRFGYPSSNVKGFPSSLSPFAASFFLPERGATTQTFAS